MGNISRHFGLFLMICLHQRRKTWVFLKKTKLQFLKGKEAKLPFMFSVIQPQIFILALEHRKQLLFDFQDFVSSLHAPLFIWKSEGERRGKHLGKSVHGEVGKFQSVLGKTFGFSVSIWNFSWESLTFFPLPFQHCIGRGVMG